MPPKDSLTLAHLVTPKAAAIARIVFSIVLIVIAIIWLLRYSVPANLLEPGASLKTDSQGATVALNLIAIAGVAFLWFIGALRDRLANLEDRFFATVFLAVFMISTSTVVIYTQIDPRWIAVLGYGWAVVLLVGSYYIRCSVVVFST